MDKRVLDPLPPKFWFRRIAAVNLASIPLTILAWYVLPLDSLIWLGVSEFKRIPMTHFAWTILIAVVWRQRETHSISADLPPMIAFAMLSSVVTWFPLAIILMFHEINAV